MTKYEELLVNEYKITWINYQKAKNNYMFAKQGLKPDYVKEPVELLQCIKKHKAYECVLYEKRLKLYGINPEEVRKGL